MFFVIIKITPHHIKASSVDLLQGNVTNPYPLDCCLAVSITTCACNKNEPKYHKLNQHHDLLPLFTFSHEMLMYQSEFAGIKGLYIYVCLWFMIVHPCSSYNLYHMVTRITLACRLLSLVISTKQP